MGRWSQTMKRGTVIGVRTHGSTHPRTRRFTADDVWAMVAAGVLDPDEPYELIDGELLYVSPQNPRHATVIERLNTLLVLAYAPDFAVRPRLPLGGIRDSIPEPDLVVGPRSPTLTTPHLVGTETVLVAEVSDSSIRRDVRKGEIYAAAGVREFWRVLVERRVVVVHRLPRPDGGWDDITDHQNAVPLPAGRGDVDLAALFA